MNKILRIFFYILIICVTIFSFGVRENVGLVTGSVKRAPQCQYDPCIAALCQTGTTCKAGENCTPVCSLIEDSEPPQSTCQSQYKKRKGVGKCNNYSQKPGKECRSKRACTFACKKGYRCGYFGDNCEKKCVKI
ncbi:hypothetical protein G9A89_006482 [Geosiphon pyriformis]|nr:hypothetical protein G9A89_006482 [Geosiphon pyriformis]